MAKLDVDSLLQELPVPLGDPQFRGALYSALTSHHKQINRQVNALQKACTSSMRGLSHNLDQAGIQDSCAVRANLRSRRIATYLVDDKGMIQLDVVKEAIGYLEKCLYSLGPDRLVDVVRQEHLLSCLRKLHTRQDIQRSIQKIYLPRDGYTQELIRVTLGLDKSVTLVDAHARRAAIAAWFCYLRQNVGSCFATAPAIIVQQEQPLLFFRDLGELLATGRLNRVYQGNEYSVPLSRNWGVGDLRKSVELHRKDKELLPPLWVSPGIVFALGQAEVLDGSRSLREKIEAVKRIVIDLIGDKEKEISVSADDILKHALFRKYDLTEEDLKAFAHTRDTPMMGMVVSTPVVGGKKIGKAERVKRYRQELEQARTTFKALADNALLRAWEFTLASFSESKSSFSRYNLYSSLGFGPEEPGGIGNKIHEELKVRLEEANREVEEHQLTCEQAYANVKYVEGRMQRARTEDEVKWLKIDMQQRQGELHHYQELRDAAHRRAQRIANLFNGLVDIYLDKFPQYFQEVYDAEIREVKLGPYDDSPAGFRLMYKAGRTATAQWLPIDSADSFVDSLAGFFQMTENEILYMEEFAGLETDISQIITRVVSHVRSNEFLETAFERMARAHRVQPIKNPLENIDEVPKKPWVYTSGGTMDNLVASYFGGGEKPTEKSRWVESPTELLAFLIDCVKGIPTKAQEEYAGRMDVSLLMHSPTHAFLLKPGATLFEQGWKDRGYTYTWIRDKYVRKAEYALDRQILDELMMRRVVDEIAEGLPEPYSSNFRGLLQRAPSRRSCIAFRQHILDTVRRAKGILSTVDLEGLAGQIDATLYRLLPFCHGHQLRDRLEKEIFPTLTGQDNKQNAALLQFYDRLSTPETVQRLYSGHELLDLVVSLVMAVESRCCFAENREELVISALRKDGYLLPPPLIFADANWMRDDFAFIVSPGNGELGLWRVDRFGLHAVPMTAWKHWIDGSRRDREWAVYTHPHEYRRG